MNLCASSQWLDLCCNKIGACVLSYGWPAFKKRQVSLIAFLCRVSRKEIFIQVGEILFAVLIYGLHSNEAGEFTAGT